SRISVLCSCSPSAVVLGDDAEPAGGSSWDAVAGDEAEVVGAGDEADAVGPAGEDAEVGAELGDPAPSRTAGCTSVVSVSSSAGRSGRPAARSRGWSDFPPSAVSTACSPV